MKFPRGLLISAFLIAIAGCKAFIPPSSASNSDILSRITDGDTIVVINNSGLGEKIRLACIDAPEVAQKVAHNEQTEFATDEQNQFAWGEKAKSHVAQLIKKGDRVTLNRTDTDRYGRTVAEVRVNGVFLQEALITAGLAVSYPHYDENCPSHELIHAAEAIAQSRKINIWSDPNFVNPGKFRRTH